MLVNSIDSAKLQAQCAMMQLPDVLISNIMERLNRPKDVVGCLIVNKRMLGLSQKVRFKLDLTEYGDVDNAGIIPKIVQSISKYAQGITCLNVADTSIESSTLGILLPSSSTHRHTPHLVELDCSNCRKIELKTDSWDPGSLKRLNLQRCFRITSASLLKLLGDADKKSQLECLAVSHLQVDKLHQQLANVVKANKEAALKLSSDQQLPTSNLNIFNCNLRVLALNNSSGLDVYSLHVLRYACPMLRALFLGGSILAHGHRELDRVVQDEQYKQVRQGVVSVLKDQSLIELVELATLLCMWRRLRLIELTFLVSTDHISLLSTIVRQVSEGELQIWNLAQECDKNSALQVVKNVQDEALLTGVRCALCCSSPSKQSLLHLAAMVGNINEVKTLLTISKNSLINVKGRFGGTAIFRACEMGHVDIVELLLREGADPWLKNSSGEVPLYIAALKGQIGVVNCLLNYFEKVGDQTWQDIQRYGDAWTPLMAAAVGNRVDIVQLLLEACRDIATFCALQNRYGQTALHIAALRGRLEIIRELISWSECLNLLNVKDSMGRTAVDIAQAHSQIPVVDYLKQHRRQLQEKVMV